MTVEEISFEHEHIFLPLLAMTFVSIIAETALIFDSSFQNLAPFTTFLSIHPVSIVDDLKLPS